MHLTVAFSEAGFQEEFEEAVACRERPFDCGVFEFGQPESFRLLPPFGEFLRGAFELVDSEACDAGGFCGMCDDACFSQCVEELAPPAALAYRC